MQNISLVIPSGNMWPFATVCSVTFQELLDIGSDSVIRVLTKVLQCHHKLENYFIL